jgi:hypothetical protein
MKYLAPLLFLLFYGSTGVYAQTERIEEVQLELNKNGILNANYPFDIQFLMKGAAPKNAGSITFSYQVQPKSKTESGYASWLSLPVRNPEAKEFYGPDTWTNSGDNNFVIYCKGIHPNLKYNFKFDIIYNLASDSVKRGLLRKKLGTLIREFYTKEITNEFITPESVQELNTKIDLILNKELSDHSSGRKLRLKSDTTQDYHADVRTNLSKAYNIISGRVGKLISVKNSIYSSSHILGPLLQRNRLPLIAEVNLALSPKTVLLPVSKELLDTRFCPGLQEFKQYTLRDGLKVLKTLAQTPSYLDSILKGKYKIANQEIIPAPAIHPESIYFLKILFDNLNEGYLIIEEGDKKDHILFQSIVKPFLIELHPLESTILSYIDAQKKAETAIADFPDITLELVSFQSLNFTALTIADVSTNKTPYISANGGIGYSSAFQKAITYYGANFYLAPVNKRARISDFKGWNYLRKVLFINVSIANYFGDRHQMTTSILGEGSSSDLFLGLGVRLNRVLEINMGGIPYKTAFNPITNEKNLKFDFVVGAAIDVNLISAFSSVGKTLKIIQ